MNILDGPRLKLNCAKKHLEALDEGIDSFIEQNPTVVTLDINIGRELQTFHLRLPSSSVPLELSILAGHAVHDMRSALDWLVCRLSEQEGADSLEGIEFPIFKSSPGPRLERKIRFLSNESKEAIRLLQPHFTEARYGHSAEIQMLWELHRLDITDKHQGLLGKGILGGIDLPEGVSKTVEVVDDNTLLVTIPLQYGDFDPKPTIDVTFSAEGLPGRITVTRLWEIHNFISHGVLPMLTAHISD